MQHAESAIVSSSRVLWDTDVTQSCDRMNVSHAHLVGDQLRDGLASLELSLALLVERVEARYLQARTLRLSAGRIHSVGMSGGGLQTSFL